MTQYRIIAFDLDDTLAPSKSPLPGKMARELAALLEHVVVCVISGGRFTQFETQLLPPLAACGARLGNLHLMPTCGTRYLRFENGAWQTVYARDLPARLREECVRVLREKARELGLWEEHPWGQIIEDRGSQITYSALGQEAPPEAKKAWDPTGEKKEALRRAAAPLLPGLEVRGGGSTSVDVTAKGVDKAFGITRLSEQTGIPLKDILFVGDRLDPGGNDYPVCRLGIDTYRVRNWEDTYAFVRAYSARFPGEGRE